MAMEQNGLCKLIEESGELSQIAGKLIQYPPLQTDRTAKHPDGTVLLDRLEEELADTLAAVRFVCLKLNLNIGAVHARAHIKLERFQKWDGEV